VAPSDQPASGDLRRILSRTAQINSDLTATGLHLMPDYAKHAPHGVFSQDDGDASEPRRTVLVQRAEAGNVAAADRRQPGTGGAENAARKPAA
jgi:hypothetical protein